MTKIVDLNAERERRDDERTVAEIDEDQKQWEFVQARLIEVFKTSPLSANAFANAGLSAVMMVLLECGIGYNAIKAAGGADNTKPGMTLDEAKAHLIRCVETVPRTGLTATFCRRCSTACSPRLGWSPFTDSVFRDSRRSASLTITLARCFTIGRLISPIGALCQCWATDYVMARCCSHTRAGRSG